MDKLEELNKIAIFKGDEIRRVSFDKEWYYVIEDVVNALTDSKNPKQYISKLRKRDEELSKGWVQFVHTLPFKTAGGKQNMNCANTEWIFRIIQSINHQSNATENELDKQLKKALNFNLKK